MWLFSVLLLLSLEKILHLENLAKVGALASRLESIPHSLGLKVCCSVDSSSNSGSGEIFMIRT